MKFIGLGIFYLCLWLFIRGYIDRQNEKSALACEVSALISVVKSGFITCPRPLSELVSVYDGKILRERGVISRISSREDIPGELLSPLDDGDIELFVRFFEDFGRDFSAMEEKKLSYAEETFSGRAQSISKECETSVKVSAVLGVSLAAAVLLLLL